MKLAITGIRKPLALLAGFAMFCGGGRVLCEGGRDALLYHRGALYNVAFGMADRLSMALNTSHPGPIATDVLFVGVAGVCFIGMTLSAVIVSMLVRGGHSKADFVAVLAR
jgi:hypothetical protein